MIITIIALGCAVVFLAVSLLISSKKANKLKQELKDKKFAREIINTPFISRKTFNARLIRNATIVDWNRFESEIDFNTALAYAERKNEHEIHEQIAPFITTHTERDKFTDNVMIVSSIYVAREGD